MKKLLIGIVAVIVVVIAIVIVAPFFIPLDTVKQQVTTRVEDATGRELTIAGDFQLSILPRVELDVGDVSFANAPGARHPNMLEVSQLRVGVALFPLLSRRVEVSSFALVDPLINLEIDENGRPNWQFVEKVEAEETERRGDAGEGGGDAGGRPGLSEISLGDVRLVNGTVRYFDARSNTAQEITSINAEIRLPSLDQPLSADGSLVWNDEKIDLALRVAEPRALMEGASTAVETTVQSAPVTLSYSGTVTNAEPAAVRGEVTLDVPSVRELAAWTGNPLTAPGDGLGPLSISGMLDMAGTNIAFRDAEIALDEMTGKGDLRLDGGGAVPSIVAALEIDRLDLNPYLPADTGPSGAAPAGEAGGKAAGEAPAAGGGEWSDDPIDFSPLKLVDADLDFTTGTILVKDIKIGRTTLKALLKGGKLALDLTEMALYDGRGTARVTVDAAGGTPAITHKLELKGVQAAPLLSDAAGFDRLEGTGNIVADVSSRGRSQRQLVSALNGNGSIQFLDGAVRGINLGAMVRNVSSAFLDPGARETRKTDFAELAGTYTITDGIVRNDDLFLKSPLLRVDGKGTANIPQRTVDYRLTPKVVATAQGQGGADQLAGVAVPVMITGPWDNLRFAPDPSGIIRDITKDPSKALEGLKKMVPGGAGEGESGSPADALKNIIPGTQGSDEESPSSDDPLGSMKKLFGR